MIASRPARAVAKIASKVRDRHRRLVSFGLYGLVIAAAYAAAFFIRFELTWPRDHTLVFLATLPVLLLIRLTLARLFRLSTSRWRFTGTQDLVRLVLAMSAGTVIFFVVTWYLQIPMPVSRSVIALEWVLSSYGIGGMWLAYRLLFQGFRRRSTADGHADRRVLLIGAGDAAALLLGEMTRFPTGYRPVGMVDDNPLRWGLTIHGVQVLGSVDDLQRIAEVERVDELIIAIPSAGPEDLSRIVERCEQTELPFRILPGIPEVLAGKADLAQLRPVQIDDLLGRQPVTLELPELAGELAGKCVLVTGAAGSIGSELSHQIALHGPRRLVLLDQAESPLVELDLRLREKFPHQTIISVVGDVTHARGIADVFAAHGPAWVFHAAAYKHVPIMQHNATEAVRNNVLGTWILARAAAQWGSHKFILVSTDKAVRPVNVMGATKRLAELIVLEAQERFPTTSFGAVRFGNVLGSNGSVIPLFQRQLKAGKPLTVTHPDISRYFMTIPEAVQLMLQASLLPALRGNVAMLDMGEPVKIVDLAKKILRLSGSPARVGEDIVFIGLRPGEKLHEELVAPDENTVGTANPQVRLVLSPDVGRLRVLGGLAAWEQAHYEGRDGTSALLGLLHRGASGTGERVASAQLSV